MKTSWNDEEDDALQGLPLRAQIIYLRGIRRYMNYTTGISGGVERRISLKMLAEISEAYFNRQREQPNKKEVIVSIDQLKKAGLIERIEDKDYLIFLLPKADINNSVQNNHGTTTAQPRHNHGTNHDTENVSNDAALSDNHGIGKNDEILLPTGTTAHIRLTGNQDTDVLREGDKKPKPTAKKTIVYPDWLNQSAWIEFEQHRKEIKKSLSDLARTKAINQLSGLTNNEQQEVIDYSITGKYPGLYPDRIKQKSQCDRAGSNTGFQNTRGNYDTNTRKQSRMSLAGIDYNEGVNPDGSF